MKRIVRRDGTKNQNARKVHSAIMWAYSVRYEKAEGDRLIDYSISMRPTRKRLLIAMGVSACSIALLLAALGPLVDFAVSVSTPGIERGDPLIVHIRKREGEKTANFTTDIKAASSLPQEQVVLPEFADLQKEVASVDSPKPPADSKPLKDWRAIAIEAAKASIDEYFRQEESRSLMWRQSRSIMFQPANNIAVKAKEPILSDIRFKRRSRVIGLGINVGSCFIGIPIAGVPVEDRSVGITVFVCG